MSKMNNEQILARRPIRAKEYQICKLKKKLEESDYKAIKYSEGLISEKDYAPIKEEREGYRKEINQLESEIAELCQKIGVLIE